MNETKKLRAFHGDPAVKEKYLARVRAHRAADEIIKGSYWDGYRGCAVGCTIHGNNHTAYETELGIPRIIARLQDGIFEGLPAADALAWPERFLAAIPAGADLSLVWPKFALWLLQDAGHGAIRFAKSVETKRVIREVEALYQRWCDGGKPAVQEWSDAVFVAFDAADADAAHAAYAAFTADAHAAEAASAASAASAAAYAAAYAAAAAFADVPVADAAEAYAVDAAAKPEHYIAQSDKLISLLERAEILKEEA